MDIFNEKNAEMLFNQVLDNPKYVFEVLSNYFSNNQVILTKELFEKNAYEHILISLSEIAVGPKHFDFAVNQLLSFSAQEVKLGIYHGKYLAYHRLKEQFYNACAKTQVPLENRKIYLEKRLQEAKNDDDYYRQFVLLKLFGMMANFGKSGEFEDIDDHYFENYIHFAIEQLMNYAGINDEHGLNCTAEEEIHHLLELTIDEPDIFGASEVPYRIFRFYLEHQREWNINPLCHLQKFHEKLEDDKKNKTFDEQHTKKLESRFEQLLSFVAQREFLVEDFILYLGAKNPNKICEIGVHKEPSTELDLHQRQSLAERLIFSGKSTLHEISRGYPKATYLVASFGLVLSDKPRMSNQSHQRVFKTIPIEIPQTTITGREYSSGGHAEEALYQYLLQPNCITTLLTRFKQILGIKDAKNHKIYAVVFDLHGTYDMCLSCSTNGLSFQNKFRKQLLSILPTHGFKTLEKYPNQLPIIIRYSSDLKYHYEDNMDPKKNGLLSILGKKGGKYDLQSMDLMDMEHTPAKRDVKNYGSNLLIHGKENFHSFWSSPQIKKFTNKNVPLEQWTAFTSDFEYKQLTTKQKKMQYTKQGLVDTEMPDVKNSSDDKKLSNKMK